MLFSSAAAPLSSQPNQESGVPIRQVAMEVSVKNSGATGISTAVVFPAGEM